MNTSIILTIIAPCFNEEENAPELIKRVGQMFRDNNIAGELVIVNDGSKDQTEKVVTELMKSNTFVKLVNHKMNKGIEQGWRSGVQAASGPFVCLIDADLQNRPEDVAKLFREIQTHRVDFVQGSRIVIGRKKDSRFYLSRGFNTLLNTVFGMSLKDNKSGFILTYRVLLQDILFHRFTYQYFQSFIAIAAKRKGYSIRQIDTVFESRRAGTSMMSAFPLKVIFRCLIDLIKGAWEYRFSEYKDTSLENFLVDHQPQKIDPPLQGWRKLLWNFYFKTTLLHKWMITSDAKYYYDLLKKSQWLTSQDLKTFQLTKLQKLVIHAYNHVPYYRQLLDASGFKPEMIKDLSDITKLPMLGKKDVRENLYFDLMSDNHDPKKILRVQTSGSTGEPFVCFADKSQLEIRWASTQRSLEWAGYTFGDRCARLWHQTLGMSWTQIFREKFDALLCRRLFIPAFQMSDKNILNFVQKLKNYDPVLIDGYAESFNFLSYYLQNQDLTGLRPKGIVSSAQILPDQSRGIIENKFGCGVFDKYGSREFSGIAYECNAHQGHHIVGDSYLLEVIKDGKPAAPGELGEVVITDLNNLCLPMIRYRLGDLAIAMNNDELCPCGRGLPRVGKIEGRVQALIFAANGSFIPGTFFAHYFKDHDQIIRQYQVVQDKKDEIILRIIKGPQFNDSKFNQIVDGLTEYIGVETIIKVEFTDKMELGRTGKHQGSISKLKFDFQELH